MSAVTPSRVLLDLCDDTGRVTVTDVISAVFWTKFDPEVGVAAVVAALTGRACVTKGSAASIPALTPEHFYRPD